MRFSHVAVTALLSGLTVSGAPTTSDDTAISDLAKQAYDKTQEQLSQAQKRSPNDSACSVKDLRVRREWGTPFQEPTKGLHQSGPMSAREASTHASYCCIRS